MFEAKNAEQPAPFEDGRMWRLLLARLHPDAGGDHDLFAFACAIRDEVSAEGNVASGDEPGNNVQGLDGAADPFLKTWYDSMGLWSSANRDALKSF